MPRTSVCPLPFSLSPSHKWDRQRPDYFRCPPSTTNLGIRRSRLLPPHNGYIFCIYQFHTSDLHFLCCKTCKFASFLPLMVQPGGPNPMKRIGFTDGSPSSIVRFWFQKLPTRHSRVRFEFEFRSNPLHFDSCSPLIHPCWTQFTPYKIGIHCTIGKNSHALYSL